MKHYLLFFIVFAPIFALNPGEEFESFNKCKIIRSDKNETMTLNCSNLSMQTVLGSWPEDGTYKRLITIFTYNNINRLEALPHSLAHNLKIVYSHCNIKELAPGIITDSVNVSHLDLSHNLITSEQLHGDVFKGPYNNQTYEPILSLKHLNLGYNQIHSLNKKLFEHVPNLEELILEGNDLKMIDVVTATAFGDIPKLQYLNLANNELMEISQGILKNFKHLQKLDISHNDLKFVPNEIGYVGEALRVLILDYNPIFEMNGDTFLGAKNLTDISANHLDLQVVKSSTFAHLENLHKLELSHNPQLTHINDEAFGNIQKLRILDISSNNLSMLYFHMLNWTDLNMLNISNNPFYCTCELFNITKVIPVNIKEHSGNKATCWDADIFTLVQLYSIGHEVCISERHMIKRLLATATDNFRILRMSVVAATVILFIVLTAAAILLYTKWRSYIRNRSYPFASQVIYNPITTEIRI